MQALRNLQITQEVGHNRIGHNYIGHNYIGNIYLGQSYIGPATPTDHACGM